MLNAVSATWAILRRPILVAFYDTMGLRRTHSRLKPPGPHGGHILSHITTTVRSARQPRHILSHMVTTVRSKRQDTYTSVSPSNGYGPGQTTSTGPSIIPTPKTQQPPTQPGYNTLSSSVVFRNSLDTCTKVR